jgi:hypothetical protein
MDLGFREGVSPWPPFGRLLGGSGTCGREVVRERTVITMHTPPTTSQSSGVSATAPATDALDHRDLWQTALGELKGLSDGRFDELDPGDLKLLIMRVQTRSTDHLV